MKYQLLPRKKHHLRDAFFLVESNFFLWNQILSEFKTIYDLFGESSKERKIKAGAITGGE